MQRTSIIPGLLALIAAVAAPAVYAQGDAPKNYADGAQKVSKTQQALQRKWIVRSVQHDGEHTGAQIGQKPGDIIHIKRAGAGLVLS